MSECSCKKIAKNALIRSLILAHDWIISVYCRHLSPDSIWRCRLTSIGNPIVEIRRSYDCLISTMGFPILARRCLYIESGPRLSYSNYLSTQTREWLGWWLGIRSDHQSTFDFFPPLSVSPMINGFVNVYVTGEWKPIDFTSSGIRCGVDIKISPPITDMCVGNVEGTYISMR